MKYVLAMNRVTQILVDAGKERLEELHTPTTRMLDMSGKPGYKLKFG